MFVRMSMNNCEQRHERTTSCSRKQSHKMIQAMSDEKRKSRREIICANAAFLS
jgi:hypothetical protein